MGSITFANGLTVELPAPVLRDIPGDGVRYVLLDSEYPNRITDNVLCYDEFGNFKWRIENILTDPTSTFGEGRIRKDGTLEFWSNDDVWFSVNKETGRVTGSRVERMGPGGESDDQQFSPIWWLPEDQKLVQEIRPLWERNFRDWLRTILRGLMGRREVYWIVDAQASSRGPEYGAVLSFHRDPRHSSHGSNLLILGVTGYRFVCSRGERKFGMEEVERIQFQRLESGAYQMKIRVNRPSHPNDSGDEFMIESDELVERVKEVVGGVDGWEEKLEI